MKIFENPEKIHDLNYLDVNIFKLTKISQAFSNRYIAFYSVNITWKTFDLNSQKIFIEILNFGNVICKLQKTNRKETLKYVKILFLRDDED